VLAWVLLVRRHGSVTLLSLVSGHKARTLAAILPLLLFSQVWLVAINVAHGNDWLGSQAAFGPFYNQDGLQGALANAVRYTLESIHLTLPAELFCSRVLGFSPIELLQWLYGLLPGYLDGTAGATEPFAITWAPGGSQSWFGPFGFLLIFPAMVYAILRGPRRLKAVAVALTGYCYLVSLVYAWSPGNARLFSLFFGCAGFSTAFLLPPWRLSLRGKRVLQIMCIILFFYALTCNTARPLFRMGTPAANTGFRLFE